MKVSIKTPFCVHGWITMKLNINDYFTLPIREKIRLFLGVSDRNQVLTDISGVNNNKISVLKNHPEKISNVQLSNIEKMEEAYKECVRNGLIKFSKDYAVVEDRSILKYDYLNIIMYNIVNFKIDNKKVVPIDYKKFSSRYRRNISHGLNLNKPNYRLTVYNNVIDELYKYKLVFSIHIRPYPMSDEKILLDIVLHLIKIPKTIK